MATLHVPAGHDLGGKGPRGDRAVGRRRGRGGVLRSPRRPDAQLSVPQTWDELAAAALARQLPDDPGSVAARLDLVGPVQSQTARSPFLVLAARFPGTTRAEVEAAYEDGSLVRGSTVRGTVHTATPTQYAAPRRRDPRRPARAVAAAAAAGARLARRPLDRDRGVRRRVAQPRTTSRPTCTTGWSSTRDATRSPRRSPVATSPSATGAWCAVPSTATGRPGRAGLPHAPPGRRGHAARRGPAPPALPRSRLAPRPRVVVRPGLRGRRRGAGRPRRAGRRRGPRRPDVRRAPDAPAPRTDAGVRLLPEFDALMCGYEPSARVRFARAPPTSTAVVRDERHGAAAAAGRRTDHRPLARCGLGAAPPAGGDVVRQDAQAAQGPSSTRRSPRSRRRSTSPSPR